MKKKKFKILISDELKKKVCICSAIVGLSFIITTVTSSYNDTSKYIDYTFIAIMIIFMILSVVDIKFEITKK